MSKKVSTLLSLIGIAHPVLERLRRGRPSTHRATGDTRHGHEPPANRTANHRPTATTAPTTASEDVFPAGGQSRHHHYSAGRRDMERWYAVDLQGCGWNLGHFMDAQERHMELVVLMSLPRMTRPSNSKSPRRVRLFWMRSSAPTRRDLIRNTESGWMPQQSSAQTMPTGMATM